MKQRDIKHCCQCGEGVGHCGPAFYTVRIKQHVLDPQAIARHSGFEQMMGNPALAMVMGVDADISQEMAATEELWICQDCAMETVILQLLDHAEGG